MAKRRGSRRVGSVWCGAVVAAVVAFTPASTSAATFFVTNSNDAGSGSLRQAMLSANATPGVDAISFSISLPPGAMATIAPLSPLPDITDALSINGYTQAGTAKNSLPTGFNAVVRVRISGASAGVGAAGFVIKATQVTIDGLIIDGFGGGAIRAVAGAPTSVIVITGCVIGKGYGAAALVGNLRGVSVESVPNTRIGGHLNEDRNVIAGNQQEGVLISGSATNTTVVGNLIGLSDTGLAEGNRFGVRQLGGSSALGNAAVGVGNTIAASGDADLSIEGGSALVVASRIGVDPGGVSSRAAPIGILFSGTATGSIGQSSITTRNVVMGTQRAIELRDATGISVANNYVCRNAVGAAIGTCLRGILVQGGGSHTIGSWYLSGTRFSQGNVVANSRVGIELSQTTGNTVESNTIEDNTAAGVLVSSSSGNFIGSLYDTALGASLGNTIRRNGGGSVLPRGGIVVASGTGNTILRNAISDNAPVGIDLGGDGVTANDANDADAGANGLQNYPLVSSATVGPTTTVTGTLASLASRSVRVQFFRSNAVNASGNAEGQVYLGETTVTTDPTGHATIAASLPTVAVGAIVTATATLLGGAPPTDTSEFSPGVAATAAVPAPTVTSILPTSGPTAGGTAVTITGTNFVAGATVTLGGSAATSVVVVSATTITAVTPSHEAGAVAVAVTTANGTGTLPGAFAYGVEPQDSPVMAALNRLRAASLIPLEVEWEHGVPIHVAGRVPAGSPSQSPSARAMTFLEEYRDLYQLVSDGSVRFRPVRQKVNQDGSVQFSVEQLRAGIPVLDTRLTLHFSGTDFTSSSGRWVPASSDWYKTAPDTLPTITVQQAFQRAIAQVGGGTPDPQGLVGKPGLVFYWPDLDHDATWTQPSAPLPDGVIEPQDLPRLAWHLVIQAPGGPWDVVVDALDGKVREVTSKVREALDLEIFDARFNTSSICFGSPFSPNHTLWFTEDGREVRVGELDGDGDGQRAYDSIRDVYAYWRDAHGRRSYDGDDSQIEMFVNYGNTANAWGGEDCLLFADDWAQLDVIGHEFTHAVTDTEPNLVGRREPGAINEHMSDVFGSMVDDVDWLIGEDIPRNGSCGGGLPQGTLRDMSDPPNCNDPDHMDPAISGDGNGLRTLAAGVDPDPNVNDNGFVHTNTGIPNKAAYLVAVGGVHNGIAVQGLGREVMANIWYGALTGDDLGRRSQFTDLRWAARMAARTRYGVASNEECQVLRAFASVGLGAPDTDCDGLDDDAEDDDDGDVITDVLDNCPLVANPDQHDADRDGLGDACDEDADNDGVLNTGDNCPLASNPGQNDIDGDGIGNACDDSDGDGVMDARDNCRTVANRDQANHDNDILGDACDADDDNDGIPDVSDNCPHTPNPGQEDGDGDGVGDVCDNCAAEANANQANTDGDLLGDACDLDDDGDNVPDASDLCPLTFDPQQIDIDRNGIGLRCDADEAFMLGGDPGWRTITLPFLDDTPIDLPVFPCVDDDCPGGGEPFAPGQRYTVRLGGVANVDASIIDALGTTVARGVREAAGQVLTFEVAPAFRAAFAAGSSMVASGTGRAAAALVSASNPWAPGPEEPAYFLRLSLRSPSTIGQPVTFSLNAGLLAGTDSDADGVSDDLDSCALVPNGTQADADGDGLGDACDNCRTTANGPAWPAGQAAQAQADADADSTGDVCDVPRYLAEGATSGFFSTRLALVNPTDAEQHVALRFLRTDGTLVTHDMAVQAQRRATFDPAALSGFDQAEFSTTIDSAGPVLVDRTLTWDATGYGSHAETAIVSPATTWYLAEGATHSGLELFYLVQNPDPVRTASVEVTFLRPGGVPPLVRTYDVGAHSRFNVWVDQIPELSNTDVSAVLRATDGVPIIVERAVYLSGHGRFFDAGHESAGVTAPATSWFLAEGATGAMFDLFVLVANPGTQPARVRATYLLPSGQTLEKEYDVAAQSRFNIWVDYEDARLADTAVSTTVESLNDVPIIVERAMWWGGDDGWYEAHNSPGATATGTVWGLAEGEVGGTSDAATYILVANTSETSASVRVRLLFEDTAPVERTFIVGAHSRFNVDVAAEFPATAGRRFGTVIESLGDPPAQIVVERAMYTSPGGVFWAAGTNALATRLQ